MFCSKCGAKNEGDSNFCAACGKPLASARMPVATSDQPSPTAGTKSDAPPPETVLWEGTVSWKAFFSKILRAVAGLVVGVVLIPVLWETNLVALGGGLVLLAAIELFRVWLRLKSTHFKLTTQRFFATDAPLFMSTTDELELFKMNDFRIRKSFFDWLFGLGKIDIISSDPTTPVLTLPGIANPNEIKEMMRSAAMKLREGKVQFHAGL